MSAVIKSRAGSTARVRGLDQPAPPPRQSAEELEIAALSARLQAAEDAGAALRRQVAELTAGLEDARREAHASGVEAGRQAAEDRHADLVEAVRASAAAALERFEHELTALETTTGGLTAVALARIVGDPEHRQGLVVDTARHATRGLFAGSVLSIEVAAKDFADPAPLQAALPAGCDLILSATASSGACRLRLRLGEVDLDLARQAERLTALLDPAASEIPA